MVSSRIGEGHGSMMDAPLTFAQTPQLEIQLEPSVQNEWLTKHVYAHKDPIDPSEDQVMAMHSPDHVHL